MLWVLDAVRRWLVNQTSLSGVAVGWRYLLCSSRVEEEEEGGGEGGGGGGGGVSDSESSVPGVDGASLSLREGGREGGRRGVRGGERHGLNSGGVKDRFE